MIPDTIRRLGKAVEDLNDFLVCYVLASSGPFLRRLGGKVSAGWLPSYPFSSIAQCVFESQSQALSGADAALVGSPQLAAAHAAAARHGAAGGGGGEGPAEAI